jgi:hypothetical protein
VSAARGGPASGRGGGGPPSIPGGVPASVPGGGMPASRFGDGLAELALHATRTSATKEANKCDTCTAASLSAHRTPGVEARSTLQGPC